MALPYSKLFCVQVGFGFQSALNPLKIRKLNITLYFTILVSVSIFLMPSYFSCQFESLIQVLWQFLLWLDNGTIFLKTLPGIWKPNKYQVIALCRQDKCDSIYCIWKEWLNKYYNTSFMQFWFTLFRLKSMKKLSVKSFLKTMDALTWILRVHSQDLIYQGVKKVLRQ